MTKLFPSHGVLHPLPADIALPVRFNNPFDYEPHGLCRLAAAEVQEYLEATLGTDCEGKMFGVLVVTDAQERPGYLAAFSGQCEAVDQSLFVPAVFDYLQPDDYFKTHEAEIVNMGTRIQAMKESPELLLARKRLQALQAEATAAISEKVEAMREGKRLRDLRRQTALTADEELTMTRESQFQKAEVKRAKAKYKPLVAEAQMAVSALESQIEAQKAARREASDGLQRWLFSHFIMVNARGERRPLTEIFSEYYHEHTKIPPATLPPSGSGECCEPKMLQYAFLHELRPRCMAMFWWGRSPEAEVRHHGEYYPACQGKCRPLLPWMLQGLDVDTPLEPPRTEDPQVVYEDADIVVLNKPSGLLSVPGKGAQPSVYSWAVAHYGKAVLLPHRLDMDTSGLLIVARNREAYIDLQRQFRDHEVQKHYVALLCGVPREPKGIIRLPLAPDWHDRPRQKVDPEQGSEAVTIYNIRYARDGEALVDLYPQTGRTHQLRLHCAHAQGLNSPIKGDRLYGKASRPKTQDSPRLHLHASDLSFRHPRTGKPMHFHVPADFE